MQNETGSKTFAATKSGAVDGHKESQMAVA
jgi:hypothetical protein